MRPSKRLSLQRVVVSDLTTDELLRVPGGFNAPPTPKCTTLNVECPSDPVTGCTVIYETRACGGTITCPTDIC